jgi:ribosomal protein L35
MPRNSTKPKLKLKTHRGAKKRFKITANGKIKRMHSGKRHLMGTKPPAACANSRS